MAAALWVASGAVSGVPAAAPPAAPRASGAALPIHEAMLRRQLQLDAAHYSPGEIDGMDGENTRRAYDAWRASRCAAGEPAADTAAPLVVPYVITEADAAGPFVEIPEDMMEKARLETLAYTSIVEALAERFHASPRLLLRLNPGARFEAGAEIRVPNVRRTPLPTAARIVVDESDHAVLALDEGDCVLARYPATLGSENDPLPLGSWKVTGVLLDPVFNYNPDLFWDADSTQSKARLPAGPNNPVGVAWVGLSKEHYGIHGTPEPSHVAKTESHGCIRLTNWDALELAHAVKPGVPVILQE
jgi:lipoprotein-anchoring transpeptidase ErfK/SrfK